MENYIVSARKYRPSTFATVVGQSALTSTLKNAIATGRLAHSYLFCGSRGVGKTSCARIMAKTINCEHPTADGEACNECASCRAFNAGNSLNIIELDAASNNSVDDIRVIIDQVQIPPANGRYRVFIIDEVHMLSSAAFNAFLKTLEEPPSYVVFILATTEKHKVLPTILSRCQIYDFSRITIQDMIDHLSHVAQAEGISYEPAALNIIARKADGAMRDALSIFDQVAASSRGNITYQTTIDNLNVLDFEYYNRLTEAFMAGDVMQTWLIYKEIRDRGFDSQFFLNGLAGYFRDLAVAHDDATLGLLDVGADAGRAMQEVSRRCSMPFLLKALELCNQADINYRTTSSKQLLVELTLAKICQLEAPPSPPQGGGAPSLQRITPTAPQTQQPPQAPQQATPAKVASPPLEGGSGGTSGGSGGARGGAGIQLIDPPRVNPAPREHGLSLRSLKHKQTDNEPTPAAKAAAQMRNNPYTEEALQRAWDSYIEQHPTDQIIINTMRAGRPVLQEANAYVVNVENDLQLNMMHNRIKEILQHIHDTLGNDFVAITLRRNSGEGSPVTWTERELLKHLGEDNEGFDDFVATLGLNLI